MHFFIWFVTTMGVNVLRWSVVSARVCERASVFLSCWYMCTTSVSPYLLSSACFKWHKCIVTRHTYLCGEDKQPNTNSFFSGYQSRSIVVIFSEHNPKNIERHTT